MRQIATYRDIEISEKQIEAGQVKDARAALKETRAVSAECNPKMNIASQSTNLPNF